MNVQHSQNPLITLLRLATLCFALILITACSQLQNFFSEGPGAETISQAGELRLQAEYSEAQGEEEVESGITVTDNVTATCTTQGWGESEVRTLTNTVGLDLSGTNIYPGALLRGQSFENGSFTPITIPRSGGTITLEGLKLEPNAKYSRDIEVIGPDTVKQAIEDILSVEVQGTAANAGYQEEQTYDYSHMLFELGIDARYGSNRMSADLSIDNSKTRNYVFAKFSQVYYDVKFSDPELSTSVFRDGGNFSDPEGQISQGNPPLYVSKVSYGRMVFFIAESTHEASEVQASLSAAVRGGLGSGTVESGLTYEEVMARTKVYYYVVGGDAGLALAPIDSASPEEMFAKVKDFIADRDAANYSASSPGVPIAYTLNYLKDRQPARMSYTINYDKKDCDFIHREVPEEPVGARVKVTLERINIILDCDVGPGEFYGSLSLNGVEVWSDSDISRDEGSDIRIDASQTRNYLFGDRFRLEGYLNEDDGASDDHAGEWDLSLNPFDYGSDHKYSDPSGPNCESRLYWRVEKISDLY